MNRIPLAERQRPQSLDEVLGQSSVIGPGKILTEIVKKGEPVNLIFWGPPGTGKTTLARILAREYHADFVELSAVTAGKKDIEQVVERARTNWNLQTRTVLFVDEIHRFNKAQQDAFLPHVESGLIILIGATTENPSFEVISPLLSRSRVITISPLSKEDIKQVLTRALKAEKVVIEPDEPEDSATQSEETAGSAKDTQPENSATSPESTHSSSKSITPSALDYLAELSGGDARSALGDLELALSLAKKVTVEVVQEAAGRKLPAYDKKGDHHYNNISAFIKSLRGSDVDATLYYLARMLAAGEDPKFIARRMVIFASEDIGLAGNGALGLALDAFQAIERVGLPEGEIILSHVAVALAKSKKSRQTYDAWLRAKSAAAKSMHLPVPLHLRNAPTKLMKDLGYGRTASGEAQQWTAGFHLHQSYLPEEIADQKFFQ